MPAYIRNALFAVVMLCAMIVGVRVYLEVDARQQYADSVPRSGQLDSAPATLPHFVLNDVWGERRNIHEWAGQPLLINFWATWCAPCRREIPLLEALHKEQSGIQVIGIAVDVRDDVATFLGEFGVSYPNLVGETDAIDVAAMLGVDEMVLPFTVLVGADGQLLTVHTGELTAGQLAEIAAISAAYETRELSAAAARAELAEI
ncbi:MAG: TlpA family protein disulfide reductase [Gammaproteobacteria bacterium]|nr:TlpA family protein disulfide reductase [Gammaproteobacteria bacterium]NND55450.1 TlpA family protein disulfide reductase [Gammaproteobacteria bacterium]